MLSFLQQLRLRTEDAHRAVDHSTSGESAHVYTGTGGGSQNQMQIIPKDTTRIRVDRSAKHLDGHVNYGRIFSLELPESILKMDANLTQGTSCLGPSKTVQVMQMMISSYKPGDVFKSESMRSLRNVAFPPNLRDKDLPTFDTSDSDLGTVLPAKRNPDYIYRLLCNGYALRSRFDGLPLHRICYYHSHDSGGVAIRNLRSELLLLDQHQHQHQRGLELDCLGMTPLHIVACSTKHHLEMYDMLIRRYPGALFTKDAWGDIPLLYLLWGRAPRDIVDFLTARMKEHHEWYIIDWERMIRTLCIGLAPIACLGYLIEVAGSITISPNEMLQDVDWNDMVRLLCTHAKAPEEHVQQFISLYQKAFPENNLNLELVSLELARFEKFGFRPFWLMLDTKRLSLLGRDKWREEIELLVETCPTGSSQRHVRNRLELTRTIYHKLALYETVAQMFVLELALWKANMMESSLPENSDSQSRSYRSHCQVTCGAHVIVPNVMEYLI